MRMSLPEKKKKKIKKKKKKEKESDITIQEAAEIQGVLIAATPALEYGLLYTRSLAIDIKHALLRNNNSYEGVMCISNEVMRLI